MLKLLSEKPKVCLLSDGTVGIDGGAMFGIVPKVFWEKFYPADEKNRVELSLNCLFIEVNDVKILIDTGIGNKFSQKYIEIYKVRKHTDLLLQLETLGVKPEDIDIVILTHLHFDHCGYNTVYNNGVVEPLFKKAKYIVQKNEWEYALSPDERSSPSYIKDNFLPIEDKIELINGNTEIKDLNLNIIYTGGHSYGHQSVLINCDDKKIFFTGDLFPVALNLKINYTSSFDLFPVDVIKKKKEILSIAEQENWIFVFPHEIYHPAGLPKEIYPKLFPS